MRPDAELHNDHFCPSPFCFLLKAAPQLPAGPVPSPRQEKLLHEEISLPVFSQAEAELGAAGSTVRESGGSSAVPSGTPGLEPGTQVHLLAVSTWQTELSSR